MSYPENLIQSANKDLSIESVIQLDKSLDQYFGIQHENQSEIHEEYYPDITQEALSTSYLDYYQMLTYIGANETLVDLGAGYCRGSLLADDLGVNKCISYEILTSRVKYAKLKLEDRASKLIINNDLCETSLIDSNYYYCYLPKNKIFYKILRELLLKSIKKPIFLFICESHGENIALCKSLAPLKLKEKFKLSLPRHNDYLHLYELSYKETELRLDDLTLWYLFHFDKEPILEFEYEHVILGAKTRLYVPMSELDLNLLGEWPCLENIHSGRIYSESRGFKLSGETSGKATKDLLAQRVSKREKLLFADQFYIERVSGELVGIDKLLADNFGNNLVIQ